MHAAADALPMPAPGPSHGARWFKANLVVALTLPLTTALVPFLIEKALPTISATMYVRAQAAYVFFVIVANLAVYAIATAFALREKLAAFSRRAWISWHLAFAVALGALLALAVLSAPAESSESYFGPERGFNAIKVF